MANSTPHSQSSPTAARPVRRGFASNVLLTAIVASLIGIFLFVVLAGVAIGRIGSWFDYNPFGVFSEPDTTINDRQPAVVVQMQSLARLETMNFSIEKVIEAEKGGNAFQDIFFGDQILLIAHGNVIAGVDLSKLEPEDVTVDDANAVRVALPPSEIFVATLNNELTRVYDREQGLLARGDAQMETEARQAAEATILQAACEQDVLQRAASEAKTQVEALLGALEFTEVTVAAPSGSCDVPQ